MNFSNIRKLSKVLSLIAALILLSAMFAGCMKDSGSDDTEPAPSLNMADDTEPVETTSEPTETQATVTENTATVISGMNIRSSPSTEAKVVGTLEAGDQVEILRQEKLLGIWWGYISEPDDGWICMDFVEMANASEEPADATDPSGSTEETTPEETTSTTKDNNTENIKGVVSVNNLNIRSEASTNGKILGHYNKGDAVTILETSNGWGRTNKGWISLQFVNTGSTTNNNTDTDKNNNSDTTVTGNGSTTVQFKGIVTASELNIRSSASTAGDKVGSYTYGDRVEILEKSGSWGRTSKGWISLDFVYQDGTSGSKTAKGVVTTTLYIRTGPGTGYASAGSYASGDRVQILEQITYNKTTWGCTNKGWICMDYVYVDGTDAGNSKTGTITGSELNIRSGPGTGYDSVGKMNKGDSVTILYQLKVSDITWGCTSKGWISMEYVDLD